jgi:hypothetical protein
MENEEKSQDIVRAAFTNPNILIDVILIAG